MLGGGIMSDMAMHVRVCFSSQVFCCSLQGGTLLCISLGPVLQMLS